MPGLANVAMLSMRVEPGLPIVLAASGKARVLGYAPREVRGRSLADFCPPRQPDGGDSAAGLLALARAALEGETRSVLWTFITADGEARPHELHISRFDREHETLVALCLVDVSRLKFGEALEATRSELLEMVATGQPLRPTLERLTATVEAQFEGLYCTVLLLDMEGRCIESGVGPRMPPEYMQALVGLAIGPSEGSCGTAMHRGERVIVTDIAHDPLWAPYRALVLPLGFRACWSEPIRAAGGAVVGSFAMYYREPHGPGERELRALQTASHLAGIAIDQARRDAERGRSAAWLEAQVRQRTAELLAAQNELVNQRKLAALGTLVSGLAHEMNTPLGNAQLAANSLTAATAVMQARLGSGAPLRRNELVDWLGQGQQAAGLVEHNLERAMRLINRFRQLTDGDARAELRRFGLRDVVTAAWARLRARRLTGAIELHNEVDAGLELEGYRDVLSEVLEQLFENACLHGFPEREATAGLATVRVGAAVQTDGRVLIELQDDGVGMPAADLARACEPFFTTSFGRGGCGLGLFVVHGQVTGLLGGALRLASTPGEGTTVRLDLPPMHAAVAALAAAA